MLHPCVNVNSDMLVNVPLESLKRIVQLRRMHVGLSAGHAESFVVRHWLGLGPSLGLLGAGHVLGMDMDALSPMITPSQHSGGGAGVEWLLAWCEEPADDDAVCDAGSA